MDYRRRIKTIGAHFGDDGVRMHWQALALDTAGVFQLYVTFPAVDDGNAIVVFYRGYPEEVAAEECRNKHLTSAQ